MSEGFREWNEACGGEACGNGKCSFRYTGEVGWHRARLAERTAAMATDEQLRDLGPALNAALANDPCPVRQRDLRRLAKAAAKEQANRAALASVVVGAMRSLSRQTDRAAALYAKVRPDGGAPAEPEQGVLL